MSIIMGMWPPHLELLAMHIEIDYLWVIFIRITVYLVYKISNYNFTKNYMEVYLGY